MIRNRGRKNYSSRSKNESVEDPHELLLSLVDMGSLDCEECLLACVSEMSDAECKRVLSSLSLPSCCDEVKDDDSELDDMNIPDDMDEDIEVESDVDTDEEPDEDDSEVEDEEDIEVELESRIRRLERNLRTESMNRNRVHRFSRRGR